MAAPIAPQYGPGNQWTDGCTSPQCNATLNAASSLTQGRTFTDMTRSLHGGRRRKGSRKSRRVHRKGSRKGSRKDRRNTRRQSGGMADYPSQFSELLPSGMHKAADVGELDTAFAQLPSFVGKYGGVGGRRRRGGKTRGRRGHRGGGFGYTPGPTNVPNYMILSPAEEPKAFLNPQWYTENQVVPSFQGPVNAFAQQSYNNQFNYAQRAGSRRHRKGHKGHKARKGSRKAHRKGSKGRKH